MHYELCIAINIRLSQYVKERFLISGRPSASKSYENLIQNLFFGVACGEKSFKTFKYYLYLSVRFVRFVRFLLEEHSFFL